MDTLKGRKVLVAGANGFFGRHLLTRLTPTGATVHALSRQVPSHPNGVEWTQADLTSAQQVHETVSRIQPDIIFHLASASYGGQDSEFVLPTLDNDLRSTVNMLLAAQSVRCSRI